MRRRVAVPRFARFPDFVPFVRRRFPAVAFFLFTAFFRGFRAGFGARMLPRQFAAPHRQA